MSEMEAGVPFWADVACPDLDQGIAFYKGLLGWEGEKGPDEYGGYTVLTLNGKMVAGVGPQMDENHPPAWSTYFKTDDSAATKEKVEANGGSLVFGPMEVMEQGTMAVFQDPTGAYFSTWQPNQHQGAQVFNETGAMSWNELYTRDIPGALAFYSAVFGHGNQQTEMGAAGTYDLLTVGDRPIAGALDMANIEIPDHIPPHWLVYFTVADIDEAIAKIPQLGGRMATDKMETPMGPFAVVADPGGAMFALIQFSSQA